MDYHHCDIYFYDVNQNGVLMNINTKITELLNIRYPIIQGGMVWAAGWKLASAVSNNGGLGLIGAGSMKPELLEEHINKCKAATSNPFGVNVPLLRGDAADLIDVVTKAGVKVVFTAAGHPGKFIEQLKSSGAKVVHVVASVKFAKKAESVECDAIVGEGVEAGGHNGLDETTTLSLIPQLVDAVNIPVIAAGGIASGQQILASLALGAEGVQIGTAFAATKESSMHQLYKDKVIEAGDNATMLILKKVGMARVIKSPFTEKIMQSEIAGADEERLRTLLGKKKEMAGMFEGNFDEGMMEAGQSAGLVKDLLSVDELFAKMLNEIKESSSRINNSVSC